MKPHADHAAASLITARRPYGLRTAARYAIPTPGNLPGEDKTTKRIRGLHGLVRLEEGIQFCHQLNYHRSQEAQLQLRPCLPQCSLTSARAPFHE